MSVTDANGKIVHYPENPDKFEFDREVAPLFPNMARRSIPNYEEFHFLHTNIVGHWFAENTPQFSMLDAGASRGEFYRQFLGYIRDHRRSAHFMQLVAIDSSDAMCNYLRAEFPNVDVRCQQLDGPAFLASDEQFNVINATYVLQFIRPERQLNVLRKLMSMVKPKGLLILGQKDASPGALGHMLHEEYVRWRMLNGYSREEIAAKTKALQNSMWPMPHETVIAELRANFTEVVETTRSMMFSTLIAMK